ncbi:hypothetical protein PHYBOEH_003208 [Phytophthora boehmeriae]|uniref:M96 mating-specific protein family n=1 Tax=Phytophthora boehmeriae TaxID=109152 RepID=A0A8T1WV79_9STRA|nr:hypothetical protein PHYBOEH_003208 [Phytophthora boehmeriae]
MSFSYVTDDAPRLSVDDVLGLIDWKEIDLDLSSPDDTSRPLTPVEGFGAPALVQPEVEPLAKAKTPTKRARKPRRPKAENLQTPTATQPVAPAAKPPAKKRIRREIVELKFLRGKVKELEEELRGLQVGFSPTAGGSTQPDGLMPSVWTSMAGRQLKDRMRAERENMELRGMLQDQLKIAQGLEDTLKQLPPNQTQCIGDQNTPILPPDLFGPSSSDTLAESLAQLEQSYLNVDETFAAEGLNHLDMDKNEIKAILHPTYGTCIRFTTRLGMPFNYDITSRVMWRFITQEGLVSLATSVNKIYTTKDIHAHCFAMRLEEMEPARDYWMNQVVRKHDNGNRTVIVGRSTIHPYVKDISRPTGVSFVDDARVIINDCSSEGKTQTCVTACVYLVPDFGDTSSDEAVGISELSEFFVKSASPVILRCREMIQRMMHEETERNRQTAVCL